jgi:hypothetical protein
VRPLFAAGSFFQLCCSLPLTGAVATSRVWEEPLSVDRLNYAAVARRLLKVGADIASRQAVKRRPPDALAVKACIDALDKELRKLEKMADHYRAEFSSTTVLEFPRVAKTAHLARCDDAGVLPMRSSQSSS